MQKKMGNRNARNVLRINMFTMSIVLSLYYLWASLLAQVVSNLPAIQETQVLSLGWQDPLEKQMATHSSNSYLENFVDRGAWWATVHG